MDAVRVSFALLDNVVPPALSSMRRANCKPPVLKRFNPVTPLAPVCRMIRTALAAGLVYSSVLPLSITLDESRLFGPVQIANRPVKPPPVRSVSPPPPPPTSSAHCNPLAVMRRR